MNNLSDMLKMAFVPMFRNTEEGGAGGAPAGDVVDAMAPAPGSNDMGIPPEDMQRLMESDPELREGMDKPAPGKKEDGADGAEGTDDDPAGKPDDSGAGKEGEPKSDDPEDKNAGAEGSEGELEFADNVIEGLKGEDLKNLSQEAQSAIGNFYQKHAEVSEELSGTKARLDALLSDPVVKQRATMLDSGETDYAVRGLNDTERTSILTRLTNEADLTPDEAKTVLKMIEGGIESVAKDMARDMAHNAIVQQDHQRKAQEVITKGQEVLLKLSEFNPKLALKEKDINKFFTKTGLNEKHPEITKFKEGIYKAHQLFHKLGFNYQTLADLGPKKAYALAAEEHGWPVVFNSGERDKKMIASERERALKPFLKSGQTRQLNPDTGAAAQKKAAPGSVMENGYDIVRLNTDGAYYEKAIRAKWGDSAHMEMIDRLAEKGRQHNQKQKR